MEVGSVSGTHIGHGHGGGATNMNMNIGSFGLGMGGTSDGKFHLIHIVDTLISYFVYCEFLKFHIFQYF